MVTEVSNHRHLRKCPNVQGLSPVVREGERNWRGRVAECLFAEVSGEAVRADADVGGNADASIGTGEGALGLARGPVLVRSRRPNSAHARKQDG